MASSRVVDVSPSGTFVRYAEVIGRGSYKIVHRGFDRERGIEVAWSKIPLSKLELDSPFRFSFNGRLISSDSSTVLTWFVYSMHGSIFRRTRSI